MRSIPPFSFQSAPQRAPSRRISSTRAALQTQRRRNRPRAIQNDPRYPAARFHCSPETPAVPAAHETAPEAVRKHILELRTFPRRPCGEIRNSTHSAVPMIRNRCHSLHSFTQKSRRREAPAPPAAIFLPFRPSLHFPPFCASPAASQNPPRSLRVSNTDRYPHSQFTFPIVEASYPTFPEIHRPKPNRFSAANRQSRRNSRITPTALFPPSRHTHNKNKAPGSSSGKKAPYTSPPPQTNPSLFMGRKTKKKYHPQLHKPEEKAPAARFRPSP